MRRRLETLLSTLGRVASSPPFELRFLIQHVLGSHIAPRESQLRQAIHQLSDAHHSQLLKLVLQRADQHKPLQYILGDQPFADLSITVRPPVLIPRWETEEWVLQLIKQIPSNIHDRFVVWDLCTGSGCIALALYKHLSQKMPQLQVYGIDISTDALRLANENSIKNGISGVKFVCADIMSTYATQDLPRPNLIVSNPPYIPAREYADGIERSVRDWEDRRALIGGELGTEFHERITTLAWQSLLPQYTLLNLPRLLMEIGADQGQLVQNIIRNQGFSYAKVKTDLAGRDRYVVGY